MAKFRYVYTDFWNDTKVLERFTPEDKLFWLYLLTNSHTKQIGVYRIPRKVLAFELGYSIESTTALLERFEFNYKLIKYNKDTSEVAIRNWGKYNLIKGGSPIECCIKSELKNIEDKKLVSYVIDSVTNKNLKVFIQNCLKEYDTCHDTYSDTPMEIDGEIQENNNSSKIAISNDTHHDTGGKLKLKLKEDIYSVEHTSSDETSESESITDAVKAPYGEIIAHYNAICKSLPKVKARSKARDKSMKSLYRKLKSLEKVTELFSKVESSDFLTGRDGRWANCGFDWILKESNYIKILEGNYDNKRNEPNKPKPPKNIIQYDFNISKEM